VILKSEGASGGTGFQPVQEASDQQGILILMSRSQVLNTLATIESIHIRQNGSA
jgi:hypothetical protein